MKRDGNSKKKKKCLRSKICNKYEECIDELSRVGSPWLRKESLSLKICQQEYPKGKAKSKKNSKKQNRLSKNCGENYNGWNTRIMGTPEGEERKEIREYLKQK